MNTQTADSSVRPETAANASTSIPEIVTPIITSDALKETVAQVAPMLAAKGDDDLMSQKQSSTAQ